MINRVQLFITYYHVAYPVEFPHLCCQSQKDHIKLQCHTIESMQRAVVVHPMIEGQCVMSRVVERMEWMDKGVQRDWECMEEDYKEKIKKRVDSILYS